MVFLVTSPPILKLSSSLPNVTSVEQKTLLSPWKLQVFQELYGSNQGQKPINICVFFFIILYLTFQIFMQLQSLSTCCYIVYSFRVTILNKDFFHISVFFCSQHFYGRCTFTLYYYNSFCCTLVGHSSVFSFILLCIVKQFMPLETKAYFSFEIQLSVGIRQGLVPVTPLDTKVCQCSSALISPPYLWVPHPQIQPPRVFNQS